MTNFRVETDSMGEVRVPADKLWGAQTQRSLEHFSIGQDLIPCEMIGAYAILKKGAALANHAGGRLSDKKDLIVQVCDEIIAGHHQDMFPLHVWMTGSGTQFNMNVNEVISNRCSQIAGHAAGQQDAGPSERPCEHVAILQRLFPSAMYIAAAIWVVKQPDPCSHGTCATRLNARPELEGHRQDRPHPYAGRHPADPRPGMVGLCRHAGR